MYLAVEHQIDDVFHTASALKVKMDESTDFSSSIANGVDGLLRQDQVEVCERVTYLEKKVRVQEDEIVCLKSAVADILRRLNQVEAEKAQNSILPTKPVFKSSTPHKTTPRTPRRTPLDNVYVTPPTRHSTPPSSAKSRTPIKKWGSMTNSTELNGSHNVSSKDPQWNSEEGNLRIYLRGRPVSLYAPSDLSDYSVDKEVTTPDQKLQLEYVFGYRGRDCRSNLYYLNGEVIYFCAGVVVLHNPEEQTQRHYLGHTDDVKCLAIHPDKVRVATGQVAGHDRKDSKPHVRIWHSTSLNTLHVIGIGDFDRSVCCLSFSKQDGGAKLCVVDESNEHELFVYDVEKGRKLANTKGSQDPVLAVEFHPSEPNSIIDVGKGHIQFWTLESGKLTKKSGVFDGGTPSSNTGPTKAAEGSYYMYTKVSNIASGSRAVLTTESASLTASSFCLSFQYHMKGLPGTLKVFAGDKTSSLTSIWEKSGVQPNPDQWKNVTIEIPQFNNPVISIEGTRGNSFRGDIAIDDLILKTPSRCCRKWYVIISTS
ncbi:echinoderm microtubule-associated protein-like 1/2 [Mytilus galloprovincialis]|uniref:Echinoderm microtubule-associated protein-like 1/2 n=1 Tax=Mytilus galloprovincialis TaxID=29158 RepID=A0A8B6GXT9_MYTGA|nr:echinoderm microtubule-associated protein-like 1/2 [Mytilus galloprovincialis]